MDFIICPNCQGQGKIESKICSTCHGDGPYLWYTGYLLFWRKYFRSGQILVEKIKKIGWYFISSALLIFGLVGLLSLFKVVSKIEEIDKLWSYFSLPSPFFLLIFWLSILTDCYLYYRLEKLIEQKRKIWPKTKRLDREPIVDWSSATRFPEKFKINVSEALSNRAEKLIQEAWLMRRKLEHQEIQPIHLFAAGFYVPEIILAFNRLGLNWQTLKDKVSRVLAQLPHSKDLDSFSFESKKILLGAYALAGGKNRLAVGPLEILESLVEAETPVKEILFDLEISLDEIKNVILWIDVYEQLRRESQRFARKAYFKPKGAMNRAMTAIATPYLDNFGQDLTQLARAGYLFPCLDREQEKAEILRILESGKQGVVLVGQPGVGKTTIINGLARQMVTEELPDFLQDKRLVSLSLSRLVAGASQPGEIEERLQMIISEVSRSGNIVLFIKDIHNMIGVRTTEGELDVSEMLADALKRKLFLLITTSIPGEYRRLVEGKGLDAVLQKIEIQEPDKNATIQILEANVAPIEAGEEIYFSYHALSRAYDLSNRYLRERFLPEKAINLLKEVAIAVKNKKGRRAIVQGEDVAEVVAEKIRIPVTKITEKESEKLIRLEEQIHQRIVDQDEAVNLVADALRRARTELRDIKRPIVNLLFLGPTGVGKTELAKTVAEVYFGDENQMIRLDISEYQEAKSIERLIGTADGSQGGLLTEAVRQNPFSLLLLDEIEKAHPDILNIFLQVMDDGRLTDVLGRTIDFTNIILIGTSNAGTDFIQEEILKGTDISTIQEVLVKEKLKPYFRPEFLNRLDGIVVFKPLGREEIKQIAQLLLNKLAKQLEAKGISLRVTPEAIAELAEAGFDPIFGARPLRRVIQERVNNALANFLLTGKLGRRDVAILEKGGVVRVERGIKI